MRKQNPILPLHDALGAALLRDLADISYERLDHAAIAALNLSHREVAERRSDGTLPKATAFRRPTAEEVDVVLFEQTWGSTALGYGGLGGAAMTPAYSVVVSTHKEACVYFGGGHLAYRVTFADMSHSQREAWNEALSNRFLPGRQEAKDKFGATDIPANR